MDYRRAQSSLNNMQVSNKTAAPDTAIKRYDLQDTKVGPMNEQQKVYEDYVLQGQTTGKFADVEAALARSGRDTNMRTSRAQQAGDPVS
jgi:hypothetical protein